MDVSGRVLKTFQKLCESTLLFVVGVIVVLVVVSIVPNQLPELLKP